MDSSARPGTRNPKRQITHGYVQASIAAQNRAVSLALTKADKEVEDANPKYFPDASEQGTDQQF